MGSGLGREGAVVVVVVVVVVIGERVEFSINVLWPVSPSMGPSGVSAGLSDMVRLWQVCNYHPDFAGETLTPGSP